MFIRFVCVRPLFITALIFLFITLHHVSVSNQMIISVLCLFLSCRVVLLSLEMAVTDFKDGHTLFFLQFFAVFGRYLELFVQNSAQCI